LLNTTIAEDRVLADMENGLVGVAGLYLSSNGGDSLADLSKQELTAKAVKGLGEIQ